MPKRDVFLDIWIFSGYFPTVCEDLCSYTTPLVPVLFLFVCLNVDLMRLGVAPQTPLRALFLSGLEGPMGHILPVSML